MSYAMFGWINRVAVGALTVSSAVPGIDASQLQNDQGSPSTAWQTTGPSDQYLVIDAGVSVTWRAFGLFRTNLSASATVRWRVGNDSAFGSAAYDSGVVSAGVSAGFGQSVTTAGADQAGRYCRLDITDPANPDGFLNIPLAFAGAVWVPQSNISYDTVLGRDDNTDEVTTRGGQEFPTLQFVRRRWDVALPGVRVPELWAQAMNLDAYARTNGNALFIPDPSGDVARETVFGRAKSLADVSFLSLDRRAWKVRFTERL